MRLFIGVELSETVKARAAGIAERLRQTIGRRATARWIAAENLHITLWFLGEVPDDRVAAIMSAVNSPFAVPAFDLGLRGAGAFPPHGAPRVFWIGVAAGQASLQALHDELALRLQPLGFQPEGRAYSAHLTLARVKDCRSREVRNLLRDIDADAGRCQVAAVTVFRSRLSPKGASYEPLLRVPLERCSR